MDDLRPTPNPYAAPQADLTPRTPPPPFPPDKTVRARIVFSCEHLAEGLERFRSQQASFANQRLLKRAMAVVFGVATIICLIDMQWLIALFMSLIAIVLLQPQKWLDRQIMRQHSKSPHHNEALELSMSNDGYHVVSELQDVTYRWSMFLRSVTFDDGVLLLLGKHTFIWVPQTALENRQDALMLAEFVASKIAASRQTTSLP